VTDVAEAVVAVACSGGRDSMALLHATAHAAAAQGLCVVALHVHHGLSLHADAWQAHVEAQCARWAKRGLPVAFAASKLTGRPSRGESVEAWARHGRYRALATMAALHGASLVLLAHHRGDQAETVLLQSLRGAGVAGLAGMPASTEREGITWSRPWLDLPRESIEAYVRKHRIAYVDDESNLDTRFARNRLREEVWPALTAAFPQAEASLAQAATWAQEAAACLDELAMLDLAAVADEAGLDLVAWGALSAPRRSNALRKWLLELLGQPAPASLARRLMSELPASRPGASWPLEGACLRRRGRVLQVMAEPVAPRARGDREATLSMRRAGRYALPGWGGTIEARRVREGGVALAWLARVDLRTRSGGERFQAGIGRPPRSLKKQFQAAGVAAWQRDAPLVYSGGLLVFVPGLGIDARVIALPGQPQVALDWVPAPSG
jgi:tRNA(Ile)-lysidine synthase